MSQAVNVNFKLDADVKKSMEQACSELGLSMSAAFTVFAKKVGRVRTLYGAWNAGKRNGSFEKCGDSSGTNGNSVGCFGKDGCIRYG